MAERVDNGCPPTPPPPSPLALPPSSPPPFLFRTLFLFLFLSLYTLSLSSVFATTQPPSSTPKLDFLNFSNSQNLSTEIHSITALTLSRRGNKLQIVGHHCLGNSKFRSFSKISNPRCRKMVDLLRGPGSDSLPRAKEARHRRTRKSNQVKLFPIITSIPKFLSLTLFDFLSNGFTLTGWSFGEYKYPTNLTSETQPKQLFSSKMANNRFEESLLFRESESLELDLEPAPELDRALNLTLAGKLISPTRPSLPNLTYFASKQWECQNRLKVYDHGRGLYTFEFVLDSDVLKVVLGGPWFIEGKLLLIQRVNPNLSINQLAFETTKIWVRCFDLPPKAFNSKFAKAIGNMLGKYCESDLQEDGTEKLLSVTRIPTVRKYLRIKTLISLLIPLKRTQSIKLRNPIDNQVDELVIRLAYERLPIFCLRCGIMGHDLEGCTAVGPILYDEGIRAEKSFKNLGESSQPVTLPDASNQPQNVAESPLINPNPLTLDPDIILANFRQYREEGILPPVPFSQEPPLFGSLSQAMVPFDNACTSLSFPQGFLAASGKNHNLNSGSSSLMSSDGLNSILGAVPDPKGKAPLHPNLQNQQSVPKAMVPNYYNPSAPNTDLFSPSSQRCLFRSELVHPALSTATKAATISPKELSPIHSTPPKLSSPSADMVKENILGGDTKGKTGNNIRGKRPAAPSKGVDTPRPKRGRPVSGSSKNGPPNAA